MWSFLRTVIIALAFAGFLGQSMARATPLPVIATASEMASDCAEMMAESAGPSDQQRTPCHEMTSDCMARMGCTAVSPVLAPGPTMLRPVARPGGPYSQAAARLDGMDPPPLRDPPKPQP